MGKFSFVVGAGLGYLLGTRSGRGQYEKIKKVGNTVWENPRVKESVQKVETKVSDMARERTAAVTDKVAATVKDRITSRGGKPGSNGSQSGGAGFQSGGGTYQSGGAGTAYGTGDTGSPTPQDPNLPHS
ncbi:YtxH domain-containing protein [Georgenia sp. SYP-B2076]|uniref:YtxH domain-containing protein n=1 Tax=Georgenia sp. SYP-B2076 TaxID=2495881 RepID=UPI000F8CFC25|nr:YtxH domain-containing protein [Georgenia sp. SYP-B2076]